MKTAFALLLVVGNVAHADDSELPDHEVAPARDTIELGVAAGYTQGVGPIGGGMPNVQDLARVGASFELDASYRVNSMLSLGVYGTLSQYAPAAQLAIPTDVLGTTAGIQAAVHVRPNRSIDPWISVGTGWRTFWFTSRIGGETTVLNALELARFQIGVDYRINQDLAIAPVIGGSFNTFFDEHTPTAMQFTNANDSQVSFVAFAGLAGRFDLSH